MRIRAFAVRTLKEMLRDPLTLLFGAGFPVVLLLLLTAIQKNVPAGLFALENLTPGIAVFGFSFLTLFSATIIAKDRESAFLQRLYTTPMRAWDFILGYLLPLLPLALVQSGICYLTAALLGLPLSVNTIYALILGFPAAFFFIALGLLCGSVLGVKPVGGLCGALLTNLTAFLSGAWFDLSLVGGVFEKIAKVFPFFHAVQAGRMVLAGDFSGSLTHFLIVFVYALAAFAAAVLLFFRQMRKK